jgi:hypothetical protein
MMRTTATDKSEVVSKKHYGKSWDWDYRKVQELMLELIKKTESSEAAALFVENNLSNPQFRVELIEKALKEKDYPKVERLAYEGIAKDEKEMPGPANDWRNYLLTLYQQTGDTKNTIHFARYFLIHSNGRYHPLRYYYDLLKSLGKRIGIGYLLCSGKMLALNGLPEKSNIYQVFIQKNCQLFIRT